VPRRRTKAKAPILGRTYVFLLGIGVVILLVMRGGEWSSKARRRWLRPQAGTHSVVSTPGNTNVSATAAFDSDALIEWAQCIRETGPVVSNRTTVIPLPSRMRVEAKVADAARKDPFGDWPSPGELALTCRANEDWRVQFRGHSYREGDTIPFEKDGTTIHLLLAGVTSDRIWICHEACKPDPLPRAWLPIVDADPGEPGRPATVRVRGEGGPEEIEIKLGLIEFLDGDAFGVEHIEKPDRGCLRLLCIVLPAKAIEKIRPQYPPRFCLYLYSRPEEAGLSNRRRYE